MRKLDEILTALFFLLIQPATCILLMASAYALWVSMDYELGACLLKIACLFAAIFMGGFSFNMVWMLIAWIGEEIHSNRLDKHYKRNPEEERKSREALAKDFEDLAKMLREDGEGD